MASMRSIGVRLRLFTDQYKQDAQEAAQANQGIGDSGKKAKRDLDGLATGMTIVGAAMVAAAAAAVYATAKFDKQMSEVKAVTGATADEFAQLREAALAAGAATVFSASEAAQAQAELAKAGLSTSDILGGALLGALDLAAAGSLDLATAATIAANAMNTFGLKGSDVAHVADVLAAASNKSAVGVEDLGLGLQQVGLIAAQVGFSLEETVGLLAALGDRGLRGSDGATSLKTALLRLAAPLPEAAKLMGDLGISLYDANGQMVDAVSIAGQLERALKDMSPAQRNAALSTIFGSDAIRAGNVLYEEGAQGIADYVAAVNDQGAAARVAAEKLDNLAGDVEALTGSLETLFIRSGEGANSGLRVLAQTLTAMVNAFASLPGPVQSTAVILAGLTGVALLSAAALVKVSAMAEAAAVSLMSMGRAGVVGAAGLRAVTAAAGPVGVALAGVTAAWAVFEMAPEGSNWKKASLLLGGIGLTLYELATAEERAATAGGLLSREEREAAAAAAELADRNIDLAGAWGIAASEADGLRLAFLALNGATHNSRSAMRDAEEAVDDLQKALRKSGGSMDITTEAGRDAQAAVDALALAAIAAAQATYDQTHSVEAANDVYYNYIQQLRDILRDAGMAEDAIDDLINEIARVPEYKGITFRITTIGGARDVDAYGNPVPRRWGGIDHAAAGMLRQATIATRPMVSWAEPETGGEAFVPRRGDYSRSMGILDAAAGWYGADVIPRGSWGASMGGSTDVNITVSAAPGMESSVLDLFRFSVSQTGSGNVQSHIGRRGRL